MGRQSRCSGCKELKSAHDFGRSGKYCTGPSRSDNEPAALAEVEELTNIESIPPADEHGAAASSHPLLHSLAESVKLLSSEMKVLRQETNKLRTFVRAPASEQSASVILPRVTLPELRAMTDLAKTVDRRVEQLNPLPSDDSGTDGEGHNLKQSAVESSPPSHPGKLKSGRKAKATSDVLYPQRWPHSFLCLTRAQREVKYEELMLAEFVAGYAQILCKDISPLERTAREKRLVSSMYFAQQYEWSAVLNFHGSVLLEIERGSVTWGDPFLRLESRTLYGNPLQGKSPTSSSPAPVLFCRDYQREQY